MNILAMSVHSLPISYEIDLKVFEIASIDFCLAAL